MNGTRISGLMSHWWSIPVGILAALVAIWLILAIALWIVKPEKAGVEDYLRLLPDLVRMLKGLATDRSMPRRIRIAMVALLAFMASPIDLIPDVIPVIGYADDVILIAVTLRWVARTAGVDALKRHWPGSPDGLDAVCRVVGATNEA